MNLWQKDRPAVRKEELTDCCIRSPSGLSHLPNLKVWHSQKHENKPPFMKAQSRNVYGVQKQKITFVKPDFLLLWKTSRGFLGWSLMFEMATFKILHVYNLVTNKQFGINCLLSFTQLPKFWSGIQFTFYNISTENSFPAFLE